MFRAVYLTRTIFLCICRLGPETSLGLVRLGPAISLHDYMLRQIEAGS
jgi:hypothetical protein